MTHTTINNFGKDLAHVLGEVIRMSEPIGVTTDDGNVVVMSEEEYRGLWETVYLTSIPGLVDEILEASATPIEERIPASEVEW